MLAEALGADVAEAISDSLIDAQVAAYSTPNRPAGTILSPAKVAWKDAADQVGKDRGTLRREVIRALGGELPTAEAMTHAATVKAMS